MVKIASKSRLKRIGLFLLLLALILVAVVLIRTWTVSAPPMADVAPPVSLKLEPQAAAQRLAGAVRFPTISAKDDKAGHFSGLRRYLV